MKLLHITDDKSKITERQGFTTQPTSEKDLIRLLSSAWNSEIIEEYIRKLVRSMPDRIRTAMYDM